MASESRVAVLKHLHTVLSAGVVGSLADGALLDRFLAGRGDADSSAAFAALVDRHGPMVLRVCRAVLGGDIHDAEDGAQAVFLVLAKKAGAIRRLDSVASWLFGVALRVAAKAKVEAARRRAIERQGTQMKACADDRRHGQLAGLYDELGRLPETYREPIILCYLEGLSAQRAAAQLGLPLRTLERRLAVGRERLRARLTRLGLDPSMMVIGGGFAAETLSEAWLETTVRAAAGLAAGQEIAAVASAGVSTLACGVSTMMVTGRLKIATVGVMAAAALMMALAGVSGAVAARRSTASIAEPRIGQVAEAPAANIGPWIKGIVVDTAGGPVGGARVSALRGAEPRFVLSKADGTFAIATDETTMRNLSLVARDEDGGRQGIFRFNDPLAGPKDPRTLARIVLKPVRGVAVSVVDGRGAPVGDASVVVLDGVLPVAQGRTDARGLVTLNAPADAMTDWILGFKPGVGFDYFENYPHVPGGLSPLPDRANLVLDSVRTVRVRVVDSTDRPVPGVEIGPSKIFKKGKLGTVDLANSPLSLERTLKVSRRSTGCRVPPRAGSPWPLRPRRIPHSRSPFLLATR